MKNKSLVTGICLLLFLTGCSGNATDAVGTTEGMIEEIQEESYELLPNQFSTFEYDEEEGELAGGSVYAYAAYESDNIMNYEEAMAKMEFAESEGRERIVVAFCDTFPEELQSAYQYEIEHYNEVEIHFEEYNTGLEWHSLDEFPYELPESYLTEGVMYDFESSYQELDLDADGEMEYLFRDECLDGMYSDSASVYKYVDGEMVCCFSVATGKLGVESLYYDGDYYLYMGNYLIHCGEGCDLLSKRYDNLPYGSSTTTIKNADMEYIFAAYECSEYSWHEGYRLEGYEGIDFQSYLPENMENHLPIVVRANGVSWDFANDAGRQYPFLRFSKSVNVEGKEYEYVFLRREHDIVSKIDVVVAVLESDGESQYNIVCMYDLINSYRYSLVDESSYINELGIDSNLIQNYYTQWGQEQSNASDLAEVNQPDEMIMDYARCIYQNETGEKILLLSYGEERKAIATVVDGEITVVYEGNGVRFISAYGNYPGIWEHELDVTNGTETYTYSEICNDLDGIKIVIRDCYVRVDEDRDGLFTEQDSYYCNGYELEQSEWECWIIDYLARVC